LADLHSGVEGGAVSEPLIDLVHVLGKLIDDEKKVLIPGNSLDNFIKKGLLSN
jgi:di- and tripeptidase